MTSETRGPRPGSIPPHVRERLERKLIREEERARLGPPWRRTWAIAAYALVALLIGFGAGRGTAPDLVADAVGVLDEEVVPLAAQADAIWSLGVGGNPPVGEALSDFQAGGDPAGVLENADAWLESYDDVISRLVALDVPVAGAPVRGLLVTGAQLSRDAVEVLATAAREDGELRETLLTEALRLRTRSQSATQAATAALRRLQVQVRGEPEQPLPDTVVPPPLPELRPSPQPVGSPAPGGSPGPAESPAPTSTPTQQPSPTGTPSPAAS